MTIHYQRRHGWHTFTSPQMPGLYVCSRSLFVALLDIWPSIKMLRKLDAA